jgi:cytochrome c peroxidase
MPLPDDGALTEAKVELGRMLFYDPILSRDSTVSCASCHAQESAFADVTPMSAGANGLVTMRNSPTLANLAWQPYMFMDGGVMTMEIQVEGPLFAHNEMDFTFFELNQRLAVHPVYRDRIRAVFGREPDAYAITRAIAAFERTMVSGNSRFDRFYYMNQEDALTESEKRGWQIFSGPVGNCTACHSLPFFTDFSFRNIGLYEAYADSGRARVTRVSSDNGRFKVPTLRNVALTAPYMHDGSMPDLESVVEHFSSGVKDHPNLDPEVYSLHLTDQQKEDLVAFLGSLTDVGFIERENLGKP